MKELKASRAEMPGVLGDMGSVVWKWTSQNVLTSWVELIARVMVLSVDGAVCVSSVE